MPPVLCLVVGNAAGWEHGMGQELGSPFSTSLYTAKQAVGTAPVLPPFLFQVFCILRGGESSKVLPGTENIILEWDDTHTNQGKILCLLIAKTPFCTKVNKYFISSTHQ